MLPYTPIHHLLFNSEKGLPALVMTSGNQSDEPLAIDNREALQRLGGLCDAILWHDRPIQRGVDDSVIIDIGETPPIPIRRARGYAPASIVLPVGCDNPGLCVGAELKNTIAIVRDGSAILSHHLGDLTHALAFDGFRKAIADFGDLFGVELRWIAHDLHPMYLSTAHARQLAKSLDVALIPVQHHHAHAASVMAEHGLHDTILAVVCDGTGYGSDGTIWGGELFAVDLLSFRRLARLRPIRLPGGDAAARDTTRCALGLLHQAFGDAFVDQEITRGLIPDETIRAVLGRMIRNDFNCATSSGAGRLFDGVAALLGICAENRFEAQAAMALESAASGIAGSEAASRDRFEVHHKEVDEIDFSPLVRELVERKMRSECAEATASLFHEQFARAWARVVIAAARQLSLDTVALSGGVFCNAIVTTRLTELLVSNGLRVVRNTIVPPNDGGVALGQAAIAAARLGQG
jgi:hydrogenase maturation protein HypF